MAEKGGVSEKRYVILVQPNGNLLVILCPLPGVMPADKVAGMESLVPSSTRRNIVAVGNVPLLSGQKKPAMVADDKITRAAGEAIPFLGMLLGFAYIGHAVRVFNGRVPPMASGCKDADLIIVDSALRGHLEAGWEQIAIRTMRNPNVLVHDRATFRLLTVHKAGESNELPIPNR